MRTIIIIFIGILLSAATPESEAKRAFDEWLIAFNANDEEALISFSEKRLGVSDIAYFRDIRDESGGLDLVKIERNEPHRFIVTMLDRESKLPRRVTVELEAAGSAKLKKLSARALQTSQSEAIGALNAFAQRMADEDRFSGVIAIQNGQSLVYQKAFGLADRRENIPVTIDTPFLFASQGKMFTAVAILQLIEAGKLKLDDPLGKYLVDYPNKEMAKVTIKQLLTHSGGTGAMGVLGPEDDANRKNVKMLDDIIKFNNERPPDFEPGSRMDYSNYGFALLGAIIEKVSDEDYYDYVKKHVLEPAAMTQTSWPTIKEMDQIAIPYTKSKGEYLISAIDTLPWRGSPAGGGVSTAADELALVNALRAGKLLSKPMFSEATKPQVEWYGYGFVTGYAGGPSFWGHGGDAPGTGTVLFMFPERDIAIACLSNRDGKCNALFQGFFGHMMPAKPIND